MPAALKLQRQFGDDVQVLFVESQGASLAEVEAFAITRTWRSSRALWTNEAPLDSGSRSLPYSVLLAGDGRVLFRGHPLERGKEIERLLVEQILRCGAPPEDVPNLVRPAWSELARGRYGRALELLRTLDPDDTADVEVERARRELAARFEKDLARVAARLELGYLAEAEARLAELAGMVKGEPGLESRCAELRSRIESPELASERRASHELARLATRFFESGGDPDVARELGACAEKHAGTRSAGRALRLSALGRVAGADVRPSAKSSAK